MMIGERSTFYDGMKPIVYFNCLVGMGAHWLSNISNTAYVCMQLYTAIVIFINWTTIYLKVTGPSDISNFRDNLFTSLNMYTVLFYTNCCVTVASPLLTWMQKKRLVECLRQMPILDDTFQAILGDRNEYRKQYIRQICQILAIVLVVSLVGICNTICSIIIEESPSVNVANFVTWHFPIIILLLLDLNFCTFVGYLQKKCRDLNDGLLAMGEGQVASHSVKKVFVVSRKASIVTPSCQSKDANTESFINNNHYVLHEIRKAHLELCKLSRKINFVFGIQNLLSIGISFGMVTGLLYTTYTALRLHSFTIVRMAKTVPPVNWTIIYAFKIWVVNYKCWSLTNETERTGDVIYELLETRVDKEIQQEVEQFAVQILQNPVRFNACGFFTLDYAFLQGVIGSITTYLIILIQMNHVSQSPTLNTTLGWNGTEILPSY